MLAEVGKGNVFTDMLVHIEDSTVNAVEFVLRVLRIMPGIIDEQRDKMRQAHIGEYQVVQTITQFQ